MGILLGKELEEAQGLLADHLALGLQLALVDLEDQGVLVVQQIQVVQLFQVVQVVQESKLVEGEGEVGVVEVVEVVGVGQQEYSKPVDKQGHKLRDILNHKL